MYENALVPLDGSKLAECVLPHVENLAKRGLIKKIILLSVVEIPSAWIAQGIDFMSARKHQIENAQKYLEDLQSQGVFKGVEVETEVLEGETAHTISEYAKINGVNLIVIATHGYTGMKRLMFGSVALRVLHDAHVPVLLIRPDTSITG
jgi:nucleotide-binding universal stress UspA family protein